MTSNSNNAIADAAITSTAETYASQGVEEGIQVAVRVRPLIGNEQNSGHVWKVLQIVALPPFIKKFTGIVRQRSNNEPLNKEEKKREKFIFPVDKVFDELASTQDVYDSVAKNIVTSVCSGLNGTIFAYGQTLSGKTYTVQGSGTIEEGFQGGGGGIVHMAAQDIFSTIASQPDREFIVRASYLEIHEDRRGVFVQSREEIVTDLAGVVELQSRVLASTAMNERSSCSHTIFRITVESKEKQVHHGAVRVSTLNIVDLAGSETVRQTGMSSPSLLALSKVITSLGNTDQGRIAFRESKLTQILEPSLSRNAKIAMLCCITPSELYLEETRSTLLFANTVKVARENFLTYRKSVAANLEEVIPAIRDTE